MRNLISTFYKVCLGGLILFCTSFMAYSQCYLGLPYMESFDTNTTPACWNNGSGWNFANSNTSGFPSPNAPGIDDHTGNNGYFAWLDASSSSFNSLTSPALQDSGINSLGISFWYYMYHPSFIPPKNYLAIDFYDGTSWHSLVDTISTNSPYWRYQTIDLGGYSTTDSIKVRFRGIKGNSSQDILLDDIFIGELPTCLPPQTVSLDTVTASTASLNIVGGTTSSLWQYEYGNTGFTIGNGSRDTTSLQTLNLQNLQPLTAYDIYVRKICAAGDTSVWYKRSFTTGCGIFTAPFSESFDTLQSPSCWSNYPLTSVYSFVFNSLNDHTGNGGYAAFRSRTNTMALETPIIDISGLSQPTLNFWLKLTSPFLASPAKSNTHLIIEVSYDATNWVPLDSFSVLDFNWQEKNINLTGLSMGDTLAFRFIGKQFSSTGVSDVDLFLDDIAVKELSACAIPYDSIFFTNITATSAHLNTAMNQADQVEYGPFGFQRGTGTTVNLPAGSAIFNNLKPGTLYTVYYRGSCTVGNSSWSLPFYFTTSCPANFSFPYSQSFNAMPFQSTDFSQACWTSYGTGSTPWVAGYSPELATGPGTNLDGYYAYTEGDSGSSGDISYLESPWVDLSQANFPYMTYNYFMYGSEMGDLCVEIFDGNKWDTVPHIGCTYGQQQTSDMQPWYYRILDLSGYSDTIKIRFKAIHGPGKYSDICVDKIRLYDTCFVADPTASFTYSLDSLTGAGQYVSFTSSSSQAAEYYWDFGDGTTDTGQTVQHIYTVNGSFTVEHYALNACAIADTAIDSLTTQGVGITTAGFRTAIKIYPNPAKGLLNIDMPNHFAKGYIEIFNSSGRKVFYTTIASDKNRVRLDLPKGTYYLKGTFNNQGFVEKLIIL